MITVNITTTPAQDNKLSNMLVSVNSQRVSQGQSAFADVNAWCTSTLTDQLIIWVQTQRETEAMAVKTAYAAASNAVQNQVRNDLGLS